jgi:hypothetical protein
MGKRSAFARRPRDAYDTPPEAVLPLLPHLDGVRIFAEPCIGDGRLAETLIHHGLTMVASGDIKTGLDALDVDWSCFPLQAIITNPPWSRPVLHRLIEHFLRCAPAWLLLDADWPHTRQAAPYLPHCSAIVAVGRVKWIEDSPSTGKDNAIWARFAASHWGPTRFYGREAA